MTLLALRRGGTHLLFVVLVLLAGCAARPEASVLQPVGIVQPAEHEVSLLAVTNRLPNPVSGGFATARASHLTYEAYNLSIPPTHRSSVIEYPGAHPDPQTDILVTSRRSLSAAGFQSLAAQSDAEGTVVLFVHGYNHSFQEALFRVGQLVADAGDVGAPVMFSWPSQGSLTGYVADRDSTLASREDLAEVIVALAEQPHVRHIVLFGHSMGAFLVMESLRQLKLQGRDDQMRKLEVVLAAPDIDVDVLRSQLDVVGRMPSPITLLVSKDDGALAASSLLGKARPRAGNIDVFDPRLRMAAKAYGLRVVDISSLAGPDPLGHNRYVSLARYANELNSAETGYSRSVAGVGLFVVDTLTSVATSPFRLVATATAAR